VHLRDSRGTIVAQGDGPPLGGSWPTSVWPIGYLLSDEHTVNLPVGLPAGEYEVVVGLYDPQTEKRVRVETGGDEVRLGTIILR
jgi:hypothetical protein